MEKPPSRVAKVATVAWKRLADISTAYWLGSLVPSGISAMIAGWLAYVEGLPKSVVVLITVGVLAFAMILFAGSRISRMPAAPEREHFGEAILKGVMEAGPGPSPAPASESLEAERERLFQIELAKLEAPDRARRHRALRRIAGGIGENFADALEEAEADRKAEAEARRRRRIREASEAPGTQEQLRAAAQALDDSVKEEETKAVRRLRAVLPPDKQADVVGGKYRNASLAEALGWAVYGEWGKPYLVSAVGIYVGAATDPRKLLARFTKIAREGNLTIWGKRDDPGFFEEIPQSHWQDNALAIADIFGSVVAGGDDPYRDLMFNRAEVEREWPHEG